MYNNAEAEDYDSPRPNRFFDRIIRKIKGQDEFEDEIDDDDDADYTLPVSKSGGSVSPIRRPSSSLRIDHGRRTHVTVRRSVQSFDDARRAADGLKSGQQQIVNLEQTPREMAERIVDFLNGATYALDGSVEKIGEQVYLFTPASVTVDVEDKPAPSARTSFLDRG